MITGPPLWEAALNNPTAKRPLFYYTIPQFGLVICSFIPSEVNCAGGTGPWALPVAGGEGFGLVPFGSGGGFGS